MYVDRTQARAIAKEKRKTYKYYDYRISFETAEKRELFVSKVISRKLKTGKSIPDILLELISKES